MPGLGIGETRLGVEPGLGVGVVPGLGMGGKALGLGVDTMLGVVVYGLGIGVTRARSSSGLGVGDLGYG